MVSIFFPLFLWRELPAPLREVMSSTRQEVGTGAKRVGIGQKKGNKKLVFCCEDVLLDNTILWHLLATYLFVDIKWSLARYRCGYPQSVITPADWITTVGARKSYSNNSPSLFYKVWCNWIKIIRINCLLSTNDFSCRPICLKKPGAQGVCVLPLKVSTIITSMSFAAEKQFSQISSIALWLAKINQI